jgi:hypothetical protein
MERTCAETELWFLEHGQRWRAKATQLKMVNYRITYAMTSYGLAPAVGYHYSRRAARVGDAFRTRSRCRTRRRSMTAGERPGLWARASRPALVRRV